MENKNTDFRVSRVKEHLHRKPDLRKFTFVLSFTIFNSN